tara:strand:- start:442 stop:726 length:285 start_codon:yes stop_codon:yes gene_type:complete
MKFINKMFACDIIVEVDTFYSIHRVEVWYNGSDKLVLGYIMKDKCVLSSSCLSSRDFEGSVAIANASQEAITIFDSINTTSREELNMLGYWENK